MTAKMLSVIALVLGVIGLVAEYLAFFPSKSGATGIAGAVLLSAGVIATALLMSAGTIATAITEGSNRTEVR